MPENPPERTYKHQVPAEVFVEAFTTLKWTAAQTKKFNKLGIERLKGSELRKRAAGLNKWYLNDNDEFTLLTNAQVTGDIIIDNRTGILPHWCIYQSKLPEISLINCQWAKVDHESKNVLNGTMFNIIDSIIGYLIIDHCKVGELNVDDKSSSGGLIITKSTMSNFEINNSDIIGNNSVSNSRIGTLTIKGSRTADFIFKKKSSIDKIIIVLSATGNFNIEDSITDDTIIGECVIGNFNISRSISGSFIANDSKIDGFTIHDYTSLGWDICDTYASFNFSKVNITQCHLQNCNISELRMGNACSIELYVTGQAINLIDFDCVILSKNSIVSLSRISLYACNISEFAMLGNLYFRNIIKLNHPFAFDAGKRLSGELHWEVAFNAVRNIYQTYQFNLKKLSNITFPSFRISQSSLGKTEFTDCDLAGFNFEYNNSKITEVFISGGTVPENVVVYDEQDKLTKVEKLHQQKSFFDQLKKVFEGQGDIVRGTKYHARTSEIQMQIITLQILEKFILATQKIKDISWLRTFFVKSKYKKFLKRIWNYLTETIYLCSEWGVYSLNKLSNKHGESWFRGLLFTLFVSLVGFHFYNIALSSPKYSFVWEWNTDYLSDWAQFIIPTHKIDFIDTKDQIFLTNSAAFRDILSRIFIGYGIYQLISAFRKHGKRG